MNLDLTTAVVICSNNLAAIVNQSVATTCATDVATNNTQTSPHSWLPACHPSNLQQIKFPIISPIPSPNYPQLSFKSSPPHPYLRLHVRLLQPHNQPSSTILPYIQHVHGTPAPPHSHIIQFRVLVQGYGCDKGGWGGGSIAG